MKMLLISICLVLFTTCYANDIECEYCCKYPTTFKNGKIYAHKSLKVGMLIPERTPLKFRCEKRFKLVGSYRIVCSGGQWIPEVPRCVEWYCPNPFPIEYGDVVSEGRPEEGHNATYICKDGYELSNGTAFISCTRDDDRLVWSGDIPQCMEKTRCDDPGNIDNGFRSGECCNQGSVLSFRCIDDLVLVGNKSVRCLVGGAWSDSKPVCQPRIFCPEPPDISRGKVDAMVRTYSNFYIPYDEVIVKCDNGYNVGLHIDMLYCTEEGLWDTEFPNCTETVCSRPKLPLNGYSHELLLTNQSKFPFGYEINFSCKDGYRLIGNRWSSCDQFGWSRRSPKCEEIRCPDPDSPENGWRRGGDFRVGNFTEFGCFTGFNLLGSVQRVCLPNGKWSGELARCDNGESNCTNPGTPIDGVKIGSSYDYRDVVKFDCKPGKFLIGSEARICRYSGEWSGEEAKCIDRNEFDNEFAVSYQLNTLLAIEKDKQKEELNAFIGQKRKDELTNVFNQAFCSNCSRRINQLDLPRQLVVYFLFDVSRSVGRSNFKKTIEFAKSLVRMIGVNETNVRIGAMTVRREVEIVFGPHAYTTTEEVIFALDNIEYGVREGATTSIVDLLKDETIRSEEDLSGNRKKFIVFILTNGKSNLVRGDSASAVKELKKAGVDIYCIGISGNQRIKDLYDVATSTEHVFVLNSYDTMTWIGKQFVNARIDYSKCGRRYTRGNKAQNIVVGKVNEKSVINPWPWIAAIQLRENPSRTIRPDCAGSIINEFWILTVAHCFDQRHVQMRRYKEITVYLGVTHLEDRSHVQEYGVEVLALHSGYSSREALFDYDIALLGLSKPIQFNAYVRPICLPHPYDELPEGTSLYRKGEIATAIGFGYYGLVKENATFVLRPVKHLKKISMPLQDRMTCFESLSQGHALFTRNMFCARNDKGVRETCSGNNGGPLMQRLKDDLQQDYWVQVGISSLGVRCGQKGNYGYYTHVAKFADWISSAIITFLPGKFVKS